MDDEYNDEYYKKYLKYKNKYVNLIDLYGGYNQIQIGGNITMNKTKLETDITNDFFLNPINMLGPTTNPKFKEFIRLMEAERGPNSKSIFQLNITTLRALINKLFKIFFGNNLTIAELGGNVKPASKVFDVLNLYLCTKLYYTNINQSLIDGITTSELGPITLTGTIVEIKDNINNKITELKQSLIDGITASDLRNITLTGTIVEIKDNINNKITELNKNSINTILTTINTSKLYITGSSGTLTYEVSDTLTTICTKITEAIKTKVESLETQNTENLDKITTIVDHINPLLPSSHTRIPINSSDSEIIGAINDIIADKDLEISQANNEKQMAIDEKTECIRERDTLSLSIATANVEKLQAISNYNNKNADNVALTEQVTSLTETLSDMTSQVDAILTAINTSDLFIAPAQGTFNASNATEIKDTINDIIIAKDRAIANATSLSSSSTSAQIQAKEQEITTLRSDKDAVTVEKDAILQAINSSALFTSSGTLNNATDITNHINTIIQAKDNIIQAKDTEIVRLTQQLQTSSSSTCPPCPSVPTGTGGIPASLSPEELAKFNRLMTAIETRIPTTQIDGSIIDNHLDTLMSEVTKITQNEEIIKNLLTRILNLTNIGEIVQKYYVRDLLDEIKNQT